MDIRTRRLKRFNHQHEDIVVLYTVYPHWWRAKKDTVFRDNYYLISPYHCRQMEMDPSVFPSHSRDKWTLSHQLHINVSLVCQMDLSAFSGLSAIRNRWLMSLLSNPQTTLTKMLIPILGKELLRCSPNMIPIKIILRQTCPRWTRSRPNNHQNLQSRRNHRVSHTQNFQSWQLCLPNCWKLHYLLFFC